MSLRPFTLDDANAMLPRLEDLFSRIDQLREEIGACHDRLQVLELLWGDEAGVEGSPDAGEAAEHRLAMEAGVLEIQRLIRERVIGAGLRFPMGGLEHGLVDFPTTWEGRWVLLCWRRGEPAVVAWHEIDAGYAGRQEITPGQAEGMGLEIVPEDEGGEGWPLP